MRKHRLIDNVISSGVSRRHFLAAGVSVAVGFNSRFASAQAATFDYYIATNGSDSNPGTQAQPWAITAINTHRSVYGGKRVGLLPGTYNVSGLQQTDAAVLLQVAPGTQSSPTVIQSVTPRAAIITAKTGSTYASNGNIIGSGANGTGVRNPYIQYITLRDLVVTGTSSGCISFDADNNVGTCPGIVIEGCVISDMVNPTGAANKGGISLGTALVGAVVRNCQVYDCYQGDISRTSHGNAAGIYDWAISSVIEYSTFYDCQSIIYQKNQGAGPPQGETFRFNYVYTKTHGMNCVFAGFNNASGSSPPYKPTVIYGNVFENASPLIYNANNGVDGFQADWRFYNNTVWCDGGGNNNAWGPMIESPGAIAAGCRISIYNNIHVRPSSKWDSARGDITIAPGSWNVFDYNLWPSDARFAFSTSGSAYPSGLNTLVQWLVLAIGVDIRSITGAPTFAGTIARGAGTQQYKLAGSSAGKGAGRVGGSLTGASVDMGAWGTGTTQIGFSGAATPPKPVAPSLSVM